MPIIPFQRNEAFDPETVDVMAAALTEVLNKLQLEDRSDAIAELVAAKIIGLARSGERDPSQLCLAALKGFKSKA